MSEYSVLSEINEYHVKKLCKKVIRMLQSLKGDNLLSPDDHGLKNVWDEICVQKQGEESVFWNAYDETVEQVIYNILKKTDKEVLRLISILEEEESGQMDDEDFSYARYHFNSDSVCKVIKYALYNFAVNYSNKKIEDYLENH